MASFAKSALLRLLLVKLLTTSASAVEHLSADSLDKFLAEHETALVEWACIYEKDHQTDFVTAADKLKGLVPIGALAIATLISCIR